MSRGVEHACQSFCKQGLGVADARHHVEFIERCKTRLCDVGIPMQCRTSFQQLGQFNSNCFKLVAVCCLARSLNLSHVISFCSLGGSSVTRVLFLALAMLIGLAIAQLVDINSEWTEVVIVSIYISSLWIFSLCAFSLRIGLASLLLICSVGFVSICCCVSPRRFFYLYSPLAHNAGLVQSHSPEDQAMYNPVPINVAVVLREVTPQNNTLVGQLSKRFVFACRFFFTLKH